MGTKGCLAIGFLEAADSIGHFVDLNIDPLFSCQHSFDPKCQC